MLPFTNDVMNKGANRCVVGHQGGLINLLSPPIAISTFPMVAVVKMIGGEGGNQ